MAYTIRIGNDETAIEVWISDNKIHLSQSYREVEFTFAEFWTIVDLLEGHTNSHSLLFDTHDTSDVKNDG